MYKHVSVLLEESISYLNIKPDGIYVDCTLGGGGHSSEILKLLTTGHLYCFDQDDYAIEKASKRLEIISNNFTIIKSNFKNIKEELAKLNVNKVDGILYDLGVSSFQFDIGDRGFSYRSDATLDMRMDQNGLLNAKDLINHYSANDLMRIFSRYGEITYSKRLAEHIIKYRENKTIETTLELSDIIKDATPMKIRQKGHPAKKVFQAIRIEVNDELKVLETSLTDALDILNLHGRIVVISFHSLEDRIVKNIFKDKSTFFVPKGLPVLAKDMQADFNLINSKVIIPTTDELEDNNRAHSAKMRVIERVKE